MESELFRHFFTAVCFFMEEFGKNSEGWNNLVEVQLVGGFQMWCGGEHYSGSRRAALDLINPPQATES